MKNFYTFVLCCVFSINAWGHGGADPLVELQKNGKSLAAEQASFSKLNSKGDQLDSLENQLRYLRKNVMILQDLMTKDYPHVRENMSRYKLDYIEELGDSLKDFRRTLTHASQMTQK
jgi:hypothetical protein